MNFNQFLEKNNIEPKSFVFINPEDTVAKIKDKGLIMYPNYMASTPVTGKMLKDPQECLKLCETLILEHRVELNKDLKAVRKAMK